MSILIKRVLLSLFFVTLIGTNVLTLTSVGFNSAISGFMATALGVQTVSDVLRQRLNSRNKTIKKNQMVAVKRKAAARRFGTRLTSRTKRVAAESIAALPGEAIPYLGISLLIAGTTYELLEACNSIEDLDQMYREMGMTEEIPDDVLRTVCSPPLPDAEAIWINVLKESGRWVDAVRGAL